MKVERNKSKVPTAHGFKKEKSFKIDSKRVRIDRSTTKTRTETGTSTSKVHNRAYGKQS